MNNTRALDTNIILFHTLKDSKFEKRASEIISNMNDGEEILIPLPVMKEVMFAMMRRGKSLREILEIFTPFQRGNVKVAEDDFSAFLEGLGIADRYRISPADGIIVSLMQQHGVTEIYSNDPDFDRVPGIKRIF